MKDARYFTYVCYAYLSVDALRIENTSSIPGKTFIHISTHLKTKSKKKNQFLSKCFIEAYYVHSFHILQLGTWNCSYQFKTTFFVKYITCFDCIRSKAFCMTLTIKFCTNLSVSPGIFQSHTLDAVTGPAWWTISTLESWREVLTLS